MNRSCGSQSAAIPLSRSFLLLLAACVCLPVLAQGPPLQLNKETEESLAKVEVRLKGRGNLKTIMAGSGVTSILARGTSIDYHPKAGVRAVATGVMNSGAVSKPHGNFAKIIRPLYTRRNATTVVVRSKCFRELFVEMDLIKHEKIFEKRREIQKWVDEQAMEGNYLNKVRDLDIQESSFYFRRLSENCRFEYEVAKRSQEGIEIHKQDLEKDGWIFIGIHRLSDEDIAILAVRKKAH